MRLVLVDNMVMTAEDELSLLDVHPHLGLISLAAVARAEGHRVSVYDPKRAVSQGALPYGPELYEAAADALLSSDPDVVGFTALGASFIFAANVAEAIRRREPDLPILLGGPHATLLDRPILERFSCFDVIVRHEAEETLNPVLANLERRDFAAIPGISWRSAGSEVLSTPGAPKITDLDSLPFPAYDLYPVDELDLELMRIEAGRGCPFECTFCSTASFFQRSYRLKSAARLVEELDRLNQRYGARHFKLDHDLFTVNRRKVLGFCEAVNGRGYRWRVSARVDCVDEELLEHMAEAGCVGIYFGIETGSERMQKITQKRLKLHLVQPRLATAHRLGIESTLSFITGYPQEEQADQDATLDMIGEALCRLDAMALPQLHPLCPEPGTPLFDRNSDDLQFDGYTTKFNALLMSRRDEQLVHDHPDIFSTYYYYPGVMPREDQTFAVDIVDALRVLGPAPLLFLLRSYEGRLSLLARAARDWIRARAGGGRIEPALLEPFVDETFGSSSPAASLVRFALAGAAVAQAAPPAVQPAAFEWDRAYRIAPWARLLEDMHDCPGLMRTIADPVGGDSRVAADERRDYLLVATPPSTSVYRIDPGARALLRLFEQPRSCRSVAAAVGVVPGGGVLDSGVFEQFVRINALIAA